MKTLDATQASLLESPSLSEVTLCKLTTYSDRLLGVVQTTRYFSDGYRLYDWGNAGTVQQFEPWLVAVATYRDTMNHLPSPDGGGLESTLRRTRKMILRNALPESGSYLYPTLRAENLEFARIEIASLLVDRGAGQDFRDLSNLTGAEATVIYRGVVAKVARVSDDAIELDLESELPVIPWLYANDASINDPRDFGKRLPVVYGKGARVQCVGWRVNRRTTLAGDVTSGVVTFPLTDGHAVPAAGNFYVDDEIVSWTSITGDTTSAVTRGVSGTTAIAHKAGAAIIAQEPLATLKWIVAAHELEALNALYIQRGDGEPLSRVSSAFTTTLADTSTIPGQTVASVSFTSSQMAAIGGPGALIDARLFADVDGVAVPYVYLSGYGFDEGTSWSVANGTQTDDTAVRTEGTSAQRLESNGMGYALRYSMDGDAANWTPSSCSIADESVITISSGSLKCLGDDGSTSGFSVQRNFASEDWTGKRLLLSVLSPFGDSLASTQGFRVTVLSSGGSRYWEYGTSTAQAITTGVWSTFSFAIGSGYTGTSAFDITDVTGIRISLGTQGAQAAVFYLDEIYFGNGGGSMPVMQRNATTGTVDLTTTNTTYRLDVRVDGVIPSDTVRVTISNTAGAGTTKPASYWRLDIPVTRLRSGEFVTLDVVATGIGGPAVPSNVETVSVELVTWGLGTVRVDNLRRQDSAAATGYIAAGGAAMEEAPDILRHVLATLCYPAQTLESTWNDAGGSGYLDDNVHACDLRHLGENAVDVIARFAFEARANVISDERSAGVEYRLLVASNAYAFPAASVTLTDWQKLDEEGRDAESVVTRFRYLYGYDPGVARGSIEAFSGVFSLTDATAEAKFGRRDAEAVPLLASLADATAEEIARFYAQELARVASLYKIQGVPWTDAYKLERGDTFSLTPPWEGSAKKLRLIETSRREDGLFDLRAVEVT